MSSGDSLGDRMKHQYENRTRFMLPRRTYTIIRVDGKAFHTFTRDCQKPFDENLRMALNYTAVKLCQEIQGAKFAYAQSDEISVVLTDFDEIRTGAWFDGNIQKIASVSASIATAAFNSFHFTGYAAPTFPQMALFDSRVFSISDPIEVHNYLVWRQKDWIRNSLQMVARSHYSHSELEGKSCQDLHEMIFQAKDNWATNYTLDQKNGWMFFQNEMGKYDLPPRAQSFGSWVAMAAPVFTQSPSVIRDRIPGIPYIPNENDQYNKRLQSHMGAEPTQGERA